MSNKPKPFVVVADDELPLLQVMEHCLQTWDYRSVGVSNKAQLLEQLSREQPALVLLDLHFGEHNGIELMQQLLADDPDLLVVILTGDGSIERAVTAIKLGAYDYLTKPPDFNRLRVILNHANTKRTLKGRLKGLEHLVKTRESAPQLLGHSPAMNQLRKLIASVAATSATALILGESGTGKELVARAIHEQSDRRLEPFVPLNMAALPSELVESTLFGHEKGAFTSADQAEIGCCEAAAGGTLFLDEIGEMDPKIQSKLLRFLQERSFQRVGSSKTRVVDVRVVAATNRNLRQSLQSGQFREDLYYRLHVLPITVPPLRDRRADIRVLAEHFLQLAGARSGKEVAGFSPEALSFLENYDWPGNVRELENLVERLVILRRGGTIELGDLPLEIRGQAEADTLPVGTVDCRPAQSESGLRRMEQIERQAIIDVLRQVQGNVRQAAKLLGLGQATIYRKMKRYGIDLETAARAQVEGAGQTSLG
jgi:two-component system, NtrC family, response regulator HydG